MRQLLAAAIATVIVGGVTFTHTVSAAPVILQPHRALYEVSLSNAKSGGQLVDIRGKMFFEWKKTCESWTTDHKSTLVYEYSDGTSARVSSGFAAYETLDGRSLDFSSKRINNGNVVEELRGHASLESANGGGAEYSMPKKLTHKLPQNTFFPMHHTIEMIERGKKGETFFQSVLFDGSDDSGPQIVNAFIGGAVDPKVGLKLNKAIDASLLLTPARKARMAFFGSDPELASAEYEMDVVMLDNGVVSDIQIIYDNFTVQQNLLALEKLPLPVCAETSSY